MNPIFSCINHDKMFINQLLLSKLCFSICRIFSSVYPPCWSNFHRLFMFFHDFRHFRFFFWHGTLLRRSSAPRSSASPPAPHGPARRPAATGCMIQLDLDGGYRSVGLQTIRSVGGYYINYQLGVSIISAYRSGL